MDYFSWILSSKILPCLYSASSQRPPGSLSLGVAQKMKTRLHSSLNKSEVPQGCGLCV